MIRGRRSGPVPDRRPNSCTAAATVQGPRQRVHSRASRDAKSCRRSWRQTIDSDRIIRIRKRVARARPASGIPPASALAAAPNDRSGGRKAGSIVVDPGSGTRPPRVPRAHGGAPWAIARRILTPINTPLREPDHHGAVATVVAGFGLHRADPSHPAGGPMAISKTFPATDSLFLRPSRPTCVGMGGATA